MSTGKYAKDVWGSALSEALEPGPLMRMFMDMPREPIDPTITWYRTLPDHEIDAELAGEWVEPDEYDPWEDA